jgi:biotin carboxyl carrier protein
VSERDEVLAMLDELGKLLGPSDATSIEVETAEYSVRVARRAAPPAPEAAAAREREARAEPEKVQRVRATTVGIFSAAKDWRKGDDVKRGTVLGAIQSLGHMADITAPADGRIDEVLVAAGAPVEYGQPLFAISLG